MPTYRKLAVKDLLVDPGYQREEKERHIERIVNEWDEVMLGALEVSQRDNGDLVVFDGQQRRAAALRRIERGMMHEDEPLPCLVHTGLTPRQEAELFTRLQDRRVPIWPLEKFKARLFGGDPVAVEIQAIADEQGYTIGSKNGIQAIVAVERTYRRGNLAATLEMLAIWKGDKTFGTIGLSMGMIGGMSRFLSLYPNSDPQRCREAWSEVSLPDIQRKVNEVMATTSLNSKDQAHLRVLRDLYNSGKRYALPPVETAIDQQRIAAAAVHRRYRRVDYSEFRDAVVDARDFSVEEMMERLGCSRLALTKKPEGFIPSALERGMIRRYRPLGRRGSYRFQYVEAMRSRKPVRRSRGPEIHDEPVTTRRRNGTVAGTGRGTKLTNKSVRDLVAELVRGNPGTTYDVVASGHVEVKHPDLPRVLLPNTPSGERSVLAARSQARRAGYKI